MAKADSVLSTPPTNTSAIDQPMMPRDPARRRFLTVTAIASVVSAGSLAATMVTAPSVLVAITISRQSRPDPVFGLIEAHRKAGCDHEAALVEQARLEQIGDNAAAWVVSEAPCHAEFYAFDALLSGVATTAPGLLAKLAYLQDIASRNAWIFSDRDDAAVRLLDGFAASVANVMAVRS